MSEGSLWELFQNEIKTQTGLLNEGILRLERMGFNDGAVLQDLMRSAHSIKGAARVVALTPIVQLAHALEDYFEAARNRKIVLDGQDADLFFQIVDLFSKIPHVTEQEHLSWMESQQSSFAAFMKKLTQSKGDYSLEMIVEKAIDAPKPSAEQVVLRIDAEKLNQMLGLAGEAMVESRRLSSYTKKWMEELQKKHPECRTLLKDPLDVLELMLTQQLGLTDQLYSEVVDSRMRPFSDGTEAFPRLVRDMAKQLNKEVSLVISGKETLIDRDILEKLENPLIHLLRNSVDHGIEPPQERIASGKPAEGKILLEAQQRAGILSITLADDGRGIDLEGVRKKIVERKLVDLDKALALSDPELMEFLYLPGFTLAERVTEISGRGIGLDIVRKMVQEVSGTLWLESAWGKGLTVHLQLPLTLSLMQALIVEIAEELYAFPLARVERVMRVGEPRSDTLPIVSGAHLLGFEEKQEAQAVVVLRDGAKSYGLAVTRFVGEKEIVVQDLEKTVGKIPAVLAGAIIEEGIPILILDVDGIKGLKSI